MTSSSVCFFISDNKIFRYVCICTYTQLHAYYTYIYTYMHVYIFLYIYIHIYFFLLYVCFPFSSMLSISRLLPNNNALISLVYYFFLNIRLQCESRESIPWLIHSDGTESSCIVTANVCLVECVSLFARRGSNFRCIIRRMHSYSNMNPYISLIMLKWRNQWRFPLRNRKWK